MRERLVGLLVLVLAFIAVFRLWTIARTRRMSRERLRVGSTSVGRLYVQF
jgi:hypothetical protein